MLYHSLDCRNKTIRLALWVQNAIEGIFSLSSSPRFIFAAHDLARKCSENNK